MTYSRLSRYAVLFFTILFLCGTGFSQDAKETKIPEKYLEDLTAAFLMFDKKASEYTVYNPLECEKRYSPASTFEILNALIGLETGVIRDEHFVIPWDSIPRSNPAWNRDHDLASAMASSAVWYFQELARRVGPQRMRMNVLMSEYGNMNISGGIEKFWLGSTLAISAKEQVAFLRDFEGGGLLYSPRSIEIVKSITTLERTDEYILRGKTGFATSRSGTVVGWFVGYVEKRDNIYFFAFNLMSRNPSRDADRIFVKRKSAALSILKDLGVL